MMTTDIQAALAQLREALNRERGFGTIFPNEEMRATDDALAEVGRLLAGPSADEPRTKRDEVLTLGRLESLLLRAELAGGSLRDAVQKELQ